MMHDFSNHSRICVYVQLQYGRYGSIVPVFRTGGQSWMDSVGKEQPDPPESLSTGKDLATPYDLGS